MAKALLTVVLLLAILATNCASIKVEPVKYVKPFLYESILIEAQPTYRHYPTIEQVNGFKELLDLYRICEYQDINFSLRDRVKSPHMQWTKDLASQFEQKNRILYDNNLKDDCYIMYMSFLPGVFIEPGREKIGGLHYGRQASMVLSRVGSKDLVLFMFHEFIHSIGLVDPERRQESPVNPERPKHCNNEECTMFWILKNNKKPYLCGLCRNDIWLKRISN